MHALHQHKARAGVVIKLRQRGRIVIGRIPRVDNILVSVRRRMAEIRECDYYRRRRPADTCAGQTSRRWRLRLAGRSESRCQISPGATRPGRRCREHWRRWKSTSARTARSSRWQNPCSSPGNSPDCPSEPSWWFLARESPAWAEGAMCRRTRKAPPREKGFPKQFSTPAGRREWADGMISCHYDSTSIIPKSLSNKTVGNFIRYRRK